jgi:lathosterol oxidase
MARMKDAVTAAGSLDGWFRRAFGDEEPTAWGSGWTAGVLAVFAGFLALGGVLCFRFPGPLTVPDFRAAYPVGLLRGALAALLLLATGLGTISLFLRRRKVLGLTGLALALLAAALGGPLVPLPAAPASWSGAGFGLDWFLLNSLINAALFVPLERAAPRAPDQLVFRSGWSTDGLYLLANHVLVQGLSAAALLPAQLLRRAVLGPEDPRLLGDLPFLVQLALIVLIADLLFYWIHRAFHRIPALWRFHAVHHSSVELDWLASFRVHLFESLVTRAAILVPLTLLGFGQGPLLVYVTLVSLHAVFNHANFGPSLRWLEPFLVTPRIHHFHHASDAEAIDKNFAVHLPFLDRLFGTYHAPPRAWPRALGVEGAPVPGGYLAQAAWPLRRLRRGNADLP